MDHALSSFPPYYQAARTHDRTETEIDFPVGLTPQPSIQNNLLNFMTDVGFDVLNFITDVGGRQTCAIFH